MQNPDITSESRKQDHIELAFKSAADKAIGDPRFYYEPLTASHPKDLFGNQVSFGEKWLKAPLWVSSMTGGTKWANVINHNLAKACNEFGLGMGLGSCRSLLYDDQYLPDFNVRNVIGHEQPLFANLGIAQLEELLTAKKISVVNQMVAKLSADGLIIHVNPMQEFLQPEGDRFINAPLHTIQSFLSQADYPVIVKEVGQGMGPESLKGLLSLPLLAIDFAAYGGTNFAKLELLRQREDVFIAHQGLMKVGHGALEMIEMLKIILAEPEFVPGCNQIIISGGIDSYLDGYFLMEHCPLPAIYGQASQFLKHARGSYQELRSHVISQLSGLQIARSFLKVKPI